MFGVQNDWFKLAATSGIEIQSASKAPSYATDASVEDSNGNTQCRTKAGETQERSCVYKICGGGDTNNSHNLDDLIEIGEVVSFDTVTHIMCTGIQVVTDNQNFPTLTVNGIQDTGATAQTHTLTSTGISVIGKKKAQAFGLGTIAAGNFVTAGSLTINAGLAECADSDGSIVKREPQTIQARATNTLQNCDAEPDAPADTASGWGLDSPDGLEESNTTHQVATVEVFKDLTRDGE